MALKVELIFRICSNIFPQTSRTQIFRAKMLSYILKYFILIKISCVTNIVNNYKNDFCMNEIPAFPTTKSTESRDDFPVPVSEAIAQDLQGISPGTSGIWCSRISSYGRQPRVAEQPASLRGGPAAPILPQRRARPCITRNLWAQIRQENCKNGVGDLSLLGKDEGRKIR